MLIESNRLSSSGATKKVRRDYRLVRGQTEALLLPAFSGWLGPKIDNFFGLIIINGNTRVIILEFIISPVFSVEGVFFAYVVDL